MRVSLLLIRLSSRRKESHPLLRRNHLLLRRKLLKLKDVWMSKWTPMILLPLWLEFLLLKQKLPLIINTRDLSHQRNQKSHRTHGNSIILLLRNLQTLPPQSLKLATQLRLFLILISVAQECLRSLLHQLSSTETNNKPSRSNLRSTTLSVIICQSHKRAD